MSYKVFDTSIIVLLSSIVLVQYRYIFPKILKPIKTCNLLTHQPWKESTEPHWHHSATYNYSTHNRLPNCHPTIHIVLTCVAPLENWARHQLHNSSLLLFHITSQFLLEPQPHGVPLSFLFEPFSPPVKWYSLATHLLTTSSKRASHVNHTLLNHIPYSKNTNKKIDTEHN